MRTPWAFVVRAGGATKKQRPPEVGEFQPRGVNLRVCKARRCPLSHDREFGEKFLLALAAIDAANARKVRAMGCGRCGGRLDIATYPRKPRGELGGAEEAFCFRESYCCRDCRGRTTPPSVRFLGRKVYIAVVVVLASVVATAAKAREMALAGWVVPGRTVRRWRTWWTTIFVASAFWTEARARFSTGMDERQMPASLLEQLGGWGATGVERLLRFTAPITTTSCRPSMAMGA